MSTNRAALITKAHRVLKKHYQPFAPPVERSLFEHVIYGCLLQGSTADQADQAFAILLQSYFDWNEVRVTSQTELTDVFTCLADPAPAAKRLKTALQNIFEAYYTFNLEEELKNRNQKNLGAAIKFLEVPGVSDFVVQYATQHGLGGHSIPVHEGVLQACVVLGILTPSEASKGRVPGLERTIPKAKGVEFASLLHQLGVDYATSPFSTKLRGILLEIAPDAKDRFPKRDTKSAKSAAEKSPAPAPKAPAPTPEAQKPEAQKPEARPAPPKAAEKTNAPKKSVAPKKDLVKQPVKSSSAKTPAKKVTKTIKKSPSKKLTKKKPK
jgi:endonuclease III